MESQSSALARWVAFALGALGTLAVLTILF
jgi:hypothetical protein